MMWNVWKLPYVVYIQQIMRNIWELPDVYILVISHIHVGEPKLHKYIS